MSKKRSIIVGGGVVGLSIAYELSRRKWDVTLFEKGVTGEQASWAGAGIFPPANPATAIHPIEHLEALSNELHPQWALRLKQETGIDPQFSVCGGIYLARTNGEKAALTGQQLYWDERQIPYERLTANRLRELVPPMDSNPLWQAFYLPTESQHHNPSHLQALKSACLKSGVQIFEQQPDLHLVADGLNIRHVAVDGISHSADRYCIACGPWTEAFVKPLGLVLPMTPVRGQMAVFKLPQQQFVPVVSEGSRYLVPRADGHVLVGATIDEVGFNQAVEPSDIDELAAWAGALMPVLQRDLLKKTWAGLRPGTFDGFPYLGRVASNSNAFIATGHFKAGLHLSPATAVVLADLMEDQTPRIDLTPFSPTRMKPLNSQ